MGAVGFDAIKHRSPWRSDRWHAMAHPCQVERRPPGLDLDVHPYLPRANVGTTSASSYMGLVGGPA